MAITPYPSRFVTFGPSPAPPQLPQVAVAWLPVVVSSPTRSALAPVAPKSQTTFVALPAAWLPQVAMSEALLTRLQPKSIITFPPQVPAAAPPPVATFGGAGMSRQRQRLANIPLTTLDDDEVLLLVTAALQHFYGD